MSNVVKLKKQAAELEAKKQFDKAIAVYVQLLEHFDENASDLDIALFNRVGDLMVKQGNVGDAVDYYEKAVDKYSEGGFFNNAIALCNKILRSSPGRTSIYYKLGKISAQKGFKADAKQNFLEYADRMQKAGKVEEAFRALKEFADLCPDQDDIRQMLAEQLNKAGRSAEAVEQLQTLYERYSAENRTGEAAATAQRMKAIDPKVEPRSGSGKRQSRAGDLVFIDLDDTPATPRKSTAIAAEPAKPAAPAPPPPPPPPEPVVEMPPAVETLEVTRAAEEPIQLESSSSLLGLESTSMAGSASTESSGELLELEPTSLAEPAAPRSPRLSSSVPSDVPLRAEAPTTPEPAAGPLDIDLEIETPTAAQPAVGKAPEPEPADMPLVDLDASLADSAEDVAAPTKRASVSMPITEERSVDTIRATVQREPQNWAAHRELGEALLEDGQREAGIRELESAMTGAEGANDLALAASVADAICRVDPDAVRHQQKRVEYAFRLNDKPKLVESYLALAEALLKAQQPDKARTVYQRVLELSPTDIRAQAALDALPAPAAPTPPAPRTSASAPRRPTPPGAARRPTPPPPVGRPPAPAPAPAAQSDASFVNLGDWLRDDDVPKDTRIVVEEKEPTGNEQSDFADMLRKFKQGVAENVEAEDYQSHYDLAIAYREMGLLDEAIAEFQKALGSSTNRVATYEALGQCFIDKGQFKVASSILARALNEPAVNDEQLLGVLYLMGCAAEAQGDSPGALSFYQRVLVFDIQFRDVADRISRLEHAVR